MSKGPINKPEIFMTAGKGSMLWGTVKGKRNYISMYSNDQLVIFITIQEQGHLLQVNVKTFMLKGIFMYLNTEGRPVELKKHNGVKD